jgi:FixJ family two-component response regulator
VPHVSPVVCLIDDDASVRKSIARLLESSGFEVEAFAEPEAFLAHLATHSVSVVILDIWMDNMNGMQLLAHLCARSPNTRIIFITGREDRAAKVTVMQAGAFAFFTKPFDNKKFLAALRNAFGHTSSEKAGLPNRTLASTAKSGSASRGQTRD